MHRNGINSGADSPVRGRPPWSASPACRALNPQQADVVNEVFTPAQADFDRASALLATYARATGDDQVGAVMLGDQMIDEASRKMAAVTVERGRAAGLRPSPQG